MQLGKRRLIVNSSLRHTFGVDADTGVLLWTRPFVTRYQVVAATPVLVGDGLFITAPDSEGGKLYRPRETDSGVQVEALWTSPLDTCHGGAVVVEDALIGSWYRRRRG